MTVCWVTGTGGTGIDAQSQVIVNALSRRGIDVELVASKSVDINRREPYIRDDEGRACPTGPLGDALLALDPDIVMFHTSNAAVRQATRTVQPHTITVSRLGVNFREQVLAGKNFIQQIPGLADYLNRVDHIVASSTRASLSMQTHGIKPDRMTRIPTAIDVDAIREPPKNPPDVIGTIGRVGKIKNQLPVIEGVSGLREIDPSLQPSLVIAGEPNDYFVNVIEDFLGQLQPNFGVNAPGFIENPMENFYPGIGIHAHPSWTENCPQTLLEAAVCGVPSVVSDVAWAEAYPALAPHLIRCKPDDPWEWTEAFHRLLTDDEYRLDRVRKQQEAVVDHYDVETVVEDYLDLFDWLRDEYQSFKVSSEVRTVA